MTDLYERCMTSVKRSFKDATNRTPSDEEIFGLLRGDTPLDELSTRVIATSGFSTLEQIGINAGIARSLILTTFNSALLINGVVSSEELADHPEVMRYKIDDVWPPDKPFPLTPLEAWYVMRGWCVAPAGGVTMEQIIEELPGRLEGGGGWVQLRR